MEMGFPVTQLRALLDIMPIQPQLVPPALQVHTMVSLVPEIARNVLQARTVKLLGQMHYVHAPSALQENIRYQVLQLVPCVDPAHTVIMVLRLARNALLDSTVVWENASFAVLDGTPRQVQPSASHVFQDFTAQRTLPRNVHLVPLVPTAGVNLLPALLVPWERIPIRKENTTAENARQAPAPMVNLANPRVQHVRLVIMRLVMRLQTALNAHVAHTQINLVLMNVLAVLPDASKISLPNRRA